LRAGDRHRSNAGDPGQARGMTAVGPPAPTDGRGGLASSSARLLAFAALAAFATAHWISLVDEPPAGRAVLALVAIVGGAAVLLAIGRARLPRLVAGALAAVAVVAAIASGLAAVGVSLSLLWPSGWDELGTNIDRGLSGLAGDIDYPYQGANEWSRLAILAAAPLALGIAAALAFWPTPGGTTSRLRFIALLALVALYATAVAINAPSSPLLRGLLLLALVAAWLWLPLLRARDLLLAAGLVAVAGAIALPAAARLDGSNPWIDYSDWTWTNEQGVAYRWNHSYAPLDWPRDGSTMFAIESDKPHYWKAITLDRFDGHRWERSEASDAGALALPQTIQEAEPLSLGSAKWLERVRVTVGALRSEFVISPGTPVAIDGLEARVSPDGTAVTLDKPLSEGDTYLATAYVPNPSEEELRAADGEYDVQLAPYTELAIPGPPTIENAGPSALRPATTVQVPLRGRGPLNPENRALVEASPYGEAYRLATELTSGAPTTFDAVKAIEDHFGQGYAYSEDPPPSDFPLASFLFEDRIGYCQQFSGAMALMLRMVGIPARVASGFAPGSPDLDQDRVFQVEDFDAHSWVEVYFTDIGWVAFDPTPAASPASSQFINAATAGAAGNLRQEFPEIRGGLQEGNARTRGRDADDGGGGSALWVFGALALLAMIVTGGAIGLRAARFSRLDASGATEAQVRELRPGLGRMGWPVRDGETLRALEKRLQRAGKPKSAGYLAGLRRRRYGADGASPPTLAARRALRRELTHARGLHARLRGLLALPPGGPPVGTRA
jgi:Transglutaminase-like superfamily/TgpA N-terminal domain